MLLYGTNIYIDRRPSLLYELALKIDNSGSCSQGLSHALLKWEVNALSFHNEERMPIPSTDFAVDYFVSIHLLRCECAFVVAICKKRDSIFQFRDPICECFHIRVGKAQR